MPIRVELDRVPNDGHTNMERDVALLGQAEQEITGCRVYSWDGPWISLGLQQNPNRDLLNPSLVPWVTRPTGGKAVLHGNDVTVGMALPLRHIAALTRLGDRVLSRSVKSVYRFVAAPLVTSLNRCGLDAALAENTRYAGRGVRTADCFAHISPNDIVSASTGLKLCGCALRLTSRAVLIQASIPYGPPLVDPATVFAKSAPVAGVTWEHELFAEALQASLASVGG